MPWEAMDTEDEKVAPPSSANTEPMDIGEGHALIVVEGADEALGVDLTVGRYNPDLPGAPGPVIDDNAE